MSIRCTILALLICFVGRSQQAIVPSDYPKIVGYGSVLHPIMAYDGKDVTYNFKNVYTVGFPIGLNLLKNDKIGYSFEVAPFLKVQNDTSKVNFILFHPGVIFRFKHNFNAVARIAFESSGRFGFTPVISKVLIKTKNVNYFVAASAPLRTGNGRPTTLGFAFQLGFTF